MKSKILSKFSEVVVGSFERFFFWYGTKVSRNPWKVIALCLLGAGLAGVGLLEYREELNAFKLWIPRGSDFVKNNEWLEKNFPPDSRYNNIIIASKDDDKDILNPDTLKEMLRIHYDVSSVTLSGDGNNKTWSDLCKKVPIISFPTLLSQNWLSKLSCDDYDKFMEYICLETSLLELWGYEEDIYDTLNKSLILEKVNQDPAMSAIFRRPIDVSQQASVILKDNGDIIGAKALQMAWIGQVNLTEMGPTSNAGTGLPVDEDSLEFEKKIYDIFVAARERLEKKGLTLYINIARGYDDIAAESILGDAYMMPIGFTIVFVYVMVMLGKFNCIETRAFLALSGLTSIGLTILTSYGLCSAFQLAYGPMHNVIPFLMLGIGIDDMFVIMQCFDNLSNEERKNDRSTQIALAMKHAGVAITVTSLTDFIVFGIGATSSLPALSSFCLYCAVGILAVYVFQSTFFVACLSLDLQRMDSDRNGICFCYKHKNHKHNANQEKYISQRVFQKIAETIMIPWVKGLVGIVTLTLLGVAIWGTVELEVRFESVWFLPPKSYLAQWFDAKEHFFPSDGEKVTVYMTELNYTAELGKIEDLLNDLNEASDIVRSTTSWYPDLKTFFNEDNGWNVPETILPQSEFDHLTSQFLFSLEYSRWQPNFYTEDELICGKPISKILMTTFQFVHKKFDGPSQHIPAMNAIKEMIDNQKFSENVFAMTPEYSNWETDEVIQSELVRNLSVSLACIFITTLILLANISGSLMVMLCVFMTLVDVLGYMHFWGLTIDVVSSINVIISIGLCVDYSAHIAHTFLTVQGKKRKDRVISTLHDIGPAVLNGGISTFIALILLAPSDSHVFSSFFRIFLLVILFGLFHGLIFFPCLLSLIGPEAYDYQVDDSKNKDDKTSESNAQSMPTIKAI